MDSKQAFEKHAKYVDFYKKIKPEKEYWGLGIENECYLMFDGLDSVTPDFHTNKASGREIFCRLLEELRNWCTGKDSRKTQYRYTYTHIY